MFSFPRSASWSADCDWYVGVAPVLALGLHAASSSAFKKQPPLQEPSDPQITAQLRGRRLASRLTIAQRHLSTVPKDHSHPALVEPKRSHRALAWPPFSTPNALYAVSRRSAPLWARKCLQSRLAASTAASRFSFHLHADRLRRCACARLWTHSVLVHGCAASWDLGPPTTDTVSIVVNSLVGCKNNLRVVCLCKQGLDAVIAAIDVDNVSPSRVPVAISSDCSLMWDELQRRGAGTAYSN